MTDSTVDLGIDGLTNIQVIGAGGSAVVYKADREREDEERADEDGPAGSDTTNDPVSELADPDTVAVKVLRLSWDPSALRRFEREQRVMSRLSRMSGFVSILETGETSDGSPYIMMPYYAGGSLQDRIRNDGPMAWPRAVRLIEQVAQTLVEAHRRDVYHRDIKPANILLSESGQAHVADFGISLIADETLGRSTVAAFTPAYSPPESFSDGLRPVASTDVYGLAATLWALLAGHAPFKEKDENVTTATIFGRVATQQIGDLRPRVPSPICHFIERSVAKMPGDRPVSMAAFLHQLREAREDSYRGLERDRFAHKPLDLPEETPELAKVPVVDTEGPTLAAGPLATNTIGDSRGPDLVILGAGVGRSAPVDGSVEEVRPAIARVPRPQGSAGFDQSYPGQPSPASGYLQAEHSQYSDYPDGFGSAPPTPTYNQGYPGGPEDPPPASAVSMVITALVAALVTSAVVLMVWFVGSRFFGGGDDAAMALLPMLVTLRRCIPQLG